MPEEKKEAEKQEGGDWQSTQGIIHRFEKAGDSLEGELVQVRDGQYFRPDGAKSKVYDIKTESGGVETCFGTMILERLMGSVKIGQQVKIVFKSSFSQFFKMQSYNFSYMFFL